MHRFLSIVLLLSFLACASDTTSKEGQTTRPAKAVETEFEDIQEVMELTDETIDPFFEGDWNGDQESRKELALHAEKLVRGFGLLQTSLKPKDVEADFSEWAKDMQGFLGQLATAAKKDTPSVQALFADPRSIGKNHCGRCHDKYRDD